MLNTVLDMYNGLAQQLWKQNSASLDTQEFESLINEAQTKYIINRAEEVELVQKRIDDLTSIKRHVIITPNIGAMDFDFEASGLVNYTDPNERFGYLRALAVGIEWKYSGNDCFSDGVPDRPNNNDDDVNWVLAYPMRSDYRYQQSKDFYWQASDEFPYYEFYSNTTSKKILKVHNGNSTASTVNRLRMEYLVHPARLTLAQPTVIDMPVHTRQEIVDLALSIFLERTESPRLPKQLQLEVQRQT